MAFRAAIKYANYVISCALYYSNVLQEDSFSCNSINYSYSLNTIQGPKNVVKHNDTKNLHSYNTMNKKDKMYWLQLIRIIVTMHMLFPAPSFKGYHYIRQCKLSATLYEILLPVLWDHSGASVPLPFGSPAVLALLPTYRVHSVQPQK